MCWNLEAQTIIIVMFSASAVLEPPKSIVITPIDCKEAEKVFGLVVI